MKIISKEPERKQHILHAAAFLTVGFLILFILSAVVRPPYGSVYNIVKVDAKLRALKEEEPGTLQVLFAGNSLACNGFSPARLFEKYGISSYVIAEESQRLCDNYEILRAGVKDQPIRAFVVEADSIFSDASPYKVNYALPTNALEELLPIFHYHIIYKKYLPGEDQDYERLHKGFLPVSDKVPYEGETDYMEKDSAAQIEYDSARYLDKLLQYCRENDIRLIIAALPCPEYWDGGKHERMLSWASEHDVPFLDMNLLTEEIGIDWEEDFSDGGAHLNAGGAQKATDYIGEFLKEQADWNTSRKHLGRKEPKR